MDLFVILFPVARGLGILLNPLYLGKPLNDYFANSEDRDEMQHDAR